MKFIIILFIFALPAVSLAEDVPVFVSYTAALKPVIRVYPKDPGYSFPEIYCQIKPGDKITFESGRFYAGRFYWNDDYFLGVVKKIESEDAKDCALPTMEIIFPNFHYSSNQAPAVNKYIFESDGAATKQAASK